MKTNSENQSFRYRVAGVVIQNDQVLVHRANHDSFWALPGGACEFGEDSRATLVRELKEELAADIKVGRLIWVVENFYDYGGKSWHEIGLYYQFEFVGKSLSFYEAKQFDGIESHFSPGKDIRLIFKWIPVSAMENEDIRPKFLAAGFGNLPTQTEVMVNHG